MRRPFSVAGAAFAVVVVGQLADARADVPIGLANPSFESGLDGWSPSGSAFATQPTLGENVVGSRANPITVGGDYWTDLPFPIGVRGERWIGTAEAHKDGLTARGNTQGDGPTGTLTSAPFKIGDGTRFITFLVGGSDDVADERVELLRVNGAAYVPIPGAAPKTGLGAEILRREWWDVAALDKAAQYAVRITDSSPRGHINVDDFRFERDDPRTAKLPDGRPALLRVTLRGRSVFTDYDAKLWGSGDTHTHLMSHLSMGKRGMHGVPDVGSIVPRGTQKQGNGCNDRDLQARSVAEALGDCSATHGGWGTDNTCGNHMRAAILNLGFDDSFEGKLPMPHEAGCAANEDYDAGLCYPKCPPGSNGVGPLCYKACPAGFRTDPMHCGKPAAYTRKGYPVGVDIRGKSSYAQSGYSWDPCRNGCGSEWNDGRKACLRDHPGGCYEGSPSIWYPNCRSGYKGVGFVCWEMCPAGFHDDGATCRRDGMEMARESCRKENPQGCEDWGAMAYGKCRPGFHAVGCCVCSPDCPAGMPDIGVSCERTQGRGVGKPPVSNVHGDHHHAGFPLFQHWPHFSSRAHQQMYVDWIRRAHDGGMNLMVALAVNNHLLGEMLEGDEPKDDKGTADLQLDEIKSFIARHSDFMALVLTPEDMRRAVREGKLAVIIGTEVDNFGNFNYATVPATEDTVRREIQRLYAKGVRYMFPVHFSDSKMGGVAVYEDMTNLGSKFARSRPLPFDAPLPPGLLYDIEGSPDPLVKFRAFADVSARGLTNFTIAGIRGLLTGIEQIPWPPAFDALKCPIPRLACLPQIKLVKNLAFSPDPAFEQYAREKRGHINRKGLFPLGRVAVKEMMRLGIIVDIDHMSWHMADEVLAIADSLHVPVSSGHNSIRRGNNSENNRTPEQMAILNRLGSTMGLGWAGGTAGAYLDSFRHAMTVKVLDKATGKETTLDRVGFTVGSDINGFEHMPHPRLARTAADDQKGLAAAIVANWSRTVCYGDARTVCPGGQRALTQAGITGSSRTWNYNTEGVAHMGLYPDIYQDLKNLGMTPAEREEFFGAADAFARMWDNVELRKGSVH